MPLPADLLPTLVAPHPKDLAARMTAEPKGSKPAAVWAWVTEISPADLYCYLGARFGAPNGLQNFLRSDDSDNLIHWEWCLDHPSTGTTIHVLGMNFRTELWIIGGLVVDDNDRLDLAARVKADFAAHGLKMTELRRSLEKWTEFVNPYQRLRRSVEKLLNDLKELDLRPDSHSVPDTSSPAEFEACWKALATRYSRGVGLCFGIRSMLPVMAEAYVNFLLFALMRPDIKADERLRESVIRQPIDVRVRGLHVNCLGFAKPVDYSTPECKAYHSLVNERNDLLHGNVVLDKLKFNEVYFHGRVPVFREYRSMWERAVGVEVRAVGLEHLHREVETVNALIAYLSSCLRPDVKQQVDRMSEKRDLGWNEQNGRIGVLFPDHLVDMHMVFEGGKSPTLRDDDASQSNDKGSA